MLNDALRLANLGFAIHWLHPRSKRPIGNEWGAKPVARTAALEASYRAGNNLGVRTGKWSRISGLYLHIIDVDIRAPEHEAEAMRRLREILPELNLSTVGIVISGSGGASRHFYILSDKAFPSKKFAHATSFKMVWDEKLGRDVKKWDWELHLLGTGSQAAIPPSIHPDTGKPYRWDRELPWDDIDFGLYDHMPSEVLERLLGYEEAEATDPERLKPIGMTIAEIRETLDDLPHEDWFNDRDGWYRVGMALHHELQGSQEAFDLWCEYSARDEKFDPKDSQRVWKSFKNRAGRPLRMASLNSVAREVRSMRAMEDIEDDFDDLSADDEDDLGFEDQPVASDEDDDDMFADILGGGSKPAPAKKPTRSQVKLAKAEVEAALGKQVPAKIRALNMRHAVARVSSKTVIMDFHSDGRVTYGNSTDLHTFYENDRVPTEKSTEPVSKAWLRHKQRREYPNGIVFAPNREVEGAYNHWQGFSVAPSMASDPSRGCKLFLKHLLEVVCSGNEEHYRYMLGWFAHMIQYPEDKPGVAVVYKGRKRIGKDTVFEYVGKLITNHYITVANQEQLLGKFNQHQEKALLLHMQEGFWAGNKQAEGSLKYLITSTQVMIEPKGMNAFPIPSVLRLFFSSNEKWVIPATEDEGRFFVLNVSDKRRKDLEYFESLRAEMEGDGPSSLLAYLQQYDLSKFRVRAVPDTEALAEQKVHGLKNIDRWWLDILQAGEMDGIQNREDGIDHAIWSTKIVEVDKRDFRSSYSNWLRSRRYDGDLLNDTEFGIRLKTLCQSVKVKHRRQKGSRIRVYALSHLDQCRREFEQFLGSELTWPEDAEIVDNESDDLA